MRTSLSFLAALELAAKSVHRRRRGAEQLALLGRDEILPMVGPLVATLDDEDPELRMLAAWALLEASPLPSQWVPDLLARLTDTRAEVRVWCCALLGECRADDVNARAALQRSATTDPAAEVRATASAALRTSSLQRC
jgi:hypothetical protein